MDRMNFYKCNLIFIGLVRVQGLTYSFHKSFILDTRNLTLKNLLLFIPPFLFSENNMKRTFFIQDLECGTMESDIFLFNLLKPSLTDRTERSGAGVVHVVPCVQGVEGAVLHTEVIVRLSRPPPQL